MPYRAALAACWALTAPGCPAWLCPVGLCPLGCASVGAGRRGSHLCAVPHTAAPDGTWSVAPIVRPGRHAVNTPVQEKNAVLATGAKGDPCPPDVIGGARPQCTA